MKEFQGKVTVTTGAASAIGRGLFHLIEGQHNRLETHTPQQIVFSTIRT
jgi:hypothetical protein